MAITCARCPAVLLDVTQYLAHVTRHNLYGCSACLRLLKSKKGVVEHWNSMHKQKFNCCRNNCVNPIYPHRSSHKC